MGIWWTHFFANGVLSVFLIFYVAVDEHFPAAIF